MPATLTVRDEALGGARSDTIELHFPTERITVASSSASAFIRRTPTSGGPHAPLPTLVVNP